MTPRQTEDAVSGRATAAAVLPAAVLPAVVLLAVGLLTAACADASNGELPPQQVPAPTDAGPLAVPFDTATAFVRTGTDSYTLRVEIAERDAQRAYGLMDRAALADDAGMVFLYERQQSGDAGFWMYRTRIPLDIAYFDGAGRIVAIRQMEPCPVQDQARCQVLASGYAPGAPYYGALEVNLGWLRERGIDVGDHVVVPGRLGS
jgi:uncharacterized protein